MRATVQFVSGFRPFWPLIEQQKVGHIRKGYGLDMTPMYDRQERLIPGIAASDSTAGKTRPHRAPALPPKINKEIMRPKGVRRAKDGRRAAGA